MLFNCGSKLAYGREQNQTLKQPWAHSDGSDYSELAFYSCLVIGLADEYDNYSDYAQPVDSPFILGDEDGPQLMISGVEAKKGIISALGEGITLISWTYHDLNYFMMYPGSFTKAIMTEVINSIILFEADTTKLFGGDRDAKRVSNIKQFQTALELRFVDQDNYPYCMDNNNCQPGRNELGVDITKVNDSGFNGTGTTYMGLVPKDPMIEEGTSPNVNCVSSPQAGCNPVYRQVSSNSYAVDFYLETDLGGLKTGSNCATENGITTGACDLNQ